MANIENQRVASVIPWTLGYKTNKDFQISSSSSYSPRVHVAVVAKPVQLQPILRNAASTMAEVHDLITAQGKRAALEAGWQADLVHAAGIYLADEEMGLGFAYSGWAQVSLPVRRPVDDAIWSVASERVKTSS